MADDIAKGSSAGFFAYLTKPVDAARLVEVVDQALSGTRSAPQES